MRLDVVLLPRDLQPHHLAGRAVVVFDVLRATTTMAAALAAGVTEIRIFGQTGLAAAARQACPGNPLLCGEENALRPEGFDLGNSPRDFMREHHASRIVFMSTTNGTRAILAAQAAAAMFTGALVNASAAAQAAIDTALDVTLLCSGTNGQIAMEDLLGCGAVLAALERHTPVFDDSDVVGIARRLFAACRHDLAGALRESRGGQNVIAAGLAGDIDFAARIDSVDVAGRVSGNPPVVRRLGRA